MVAACRSEAGFTLVELVVASALVLLVMSGLFQALHPAQSAFQAEAERADVQQRLRVAVTVLSTALSEAGRGAAFGLDAGSLSTHMSAVFPYRIGRRNADPPETFRRDVISVVAVDHGAVQSTLAQPFPARSGDAVINIDPGCALTDASCGFREDATVLVIGTDGHFGLFTVTAVNGATLTLQHNTRDSAYVFPPGSPIVAASNRTFSLRSDLANDQLQLMRYDGDGGADVPVVDHVASLSFRYRAEPDPPRPLRLPSELTGPWTTYGPKPPEATVQTSAYPVGENCVFALDGALAPAPRLSSLGATLVELSPEQLTDGPWCGDDTDPNRFDADLLRVRAISVSVRTEAAAPSLRGPAGLLFVRPGTSQASVRMVPDAEATFDVAPFNLEPGR